METRTTFLVRVIRAALLGALITMGLFSLANAQTGGNLKSDSELFTEIRKADSVLFNAFNTRDTNLFKEFFTNDLEFYHDKGGLTGYDHTINFMRTTSKPGNDLKRELVDGTIEIYPVPGYGAMQIGQHRFCHTENGKPDCGTFKFVHIWQKKDGKWKITRVVSYDH